MRRMASRLNDVARKVGVSEATVSRVLNDRPGVSARTRQEVLSALDSLGYERPIKLRGERARLVGLVMPELGNPIFPALAEVLGGGLAQQGYTPVLCITAAGGISEQDYVGLLLHQQVSGVLFAGGLYTQEGAEHGHYQRLREAGVPTVLVNAPVDGMGLATVSCDDAASTEFALVHLNQLGHERVGMLLGPADHVPSQRKLAAAHAVAERLGMDLPASLVSHAFYSLESGQAATERLLREGVTAIIAASDLLALGAVRAVRRAGLRVPQDVSVVGYDDSALMNSTDPPLTTVRQPIEAMGRMAIEMLVRQMSTTFVGSDEVFFTPELVVRSTTGPVPR